LIARGIQRLSSRAQHGRTDVPRVVITGGAGLIGSHLCEAFVASGKHVVCLDNLSTGSLSNLRALQGSKEFTLVVSDVTDGLQMIDGPIEAVLHLASPASPADYLSHPLETLAAGSTGTRNALALATEHGARFLLASTSEIYGEPIEHPQSESYWGNVNPIGLRSVYDESKRFAEALTMAWHRSLNTNVGIVRIFNTYGPRMRHNDGRVVSNFLVQAMEGRPLTVYGDGQQTRCMCFVDDTVEGILKVLDSDVSTPVNLGSPDEISMIELAHRVIKVTESTSTIVHAPLPEDDPTRRCPNIALARELFHWEPIVSLNEGLIRTATFFSTLGVGRTGDEPATSAEDPGTRETLGSGT
jgi:dTDP-glucose 4,6-dehydratase